MHPIRKGVNNLWVGFRFWIYKLGSFLAAALPARFGYWVGNIIGDVVYFSMKQLSANTVSNMRRVLGEEASWQTVKTTARASFRNYCKTIVSKSASKGPIKHKTRIMRACASSLSTCHASHTELDC